MDKDIPYIVFEGEMARSERHIKRLWITIIVLIFAIIGICTGFLVYLSQFDYESYEVSTEGGGNANYIGNDGDINNGTGYSSSQTEKEWIS